MPKKVPRTETLESHAYMDGLFEDFREQVSRYQSLTTRLMEIEARLELAEKMLRLTRDHLEMTLATTEGARDRAKEFEKESAQVRFVGLRLVDACESVLKEHRKMTPQKLLDAINSGTFRFRTNSPLREIHAALLRHPHVKREGNYYIWNAPKEEQIPMRLRASKALAAASAGPETKPN